MLSFGIMLLLVGSVSMLFIHITDSTNDELIELDGTYHIKEFHITELESIGFYKIEINNFNENRIFIQIFDSKQNIIHDKKIETEISVNYFDINSDGEYEIILTNLSDSNLKLVFEYGNLDYSKIILPGMMLLIGLICTILSTYSNLRNYTSKRI